MKEGILTPDEPLQATFEAFFQDLKNAISDHWPRFNGENFKAQVRLVFDETRGEAWLPTQFYQWQKTFFENGAAAFAKTSGPRATIQTEQKMAKLEKKLQRKDEVIAEIMAEHILLKKELGES